MFLGRLIFVVACLLITNLNSHANTTPAECQRRAMIAYDLGSSDAEKQRLGAQAASTCFKDMGKDTESSSVNNHPGDNPFIVGISFGLFLAIAVAWLVSISTDSDVGVYAGVSVITGAILVLATVGVINVQFTSFTKGEGLESFALWAYLFFSAPQVLLIWWTRNNAIAARLGAGLDHDDDQ